jgi:Zn-dependent alcohol dehydrogenase
MWEQTFSGPLIDGVTATAEANSVQQTSDGGYVLVGSYTGGVSKSSSLPFLIKTDSSGNVPLSDPSTFRITFEEFGNAVAYSVQQMSNGAFVLAGAILDSQSAWLVIY